MRRASLEEKGWISVDTAPLNEDVKLLVTDGQGGPYVLPHPCRRTESALCRKLMEPERTSV